MKILLIFLILTSFLLQTHGQTDRSKIDSKDLRAFVKILTSDSLEGRGTGTEGQRKAARFISERFKHLGLAQYNNDGYFQRFALNQVYWGQVYIKTPNQTLENFQNMVFQGSTPQNDEIEKEVVFGGTGTDVELKQIKLKDRFVLVFVENLRSYYELNRRLSQTGAYGLIIANPNNEKQFESIKNTFKDHLLQKRLAFPSIDTTKNIYASWDTVRLINTITIPNSEIKSFFKLNQKELLDKVKGNRLGDIPVTKVKIKFEKVIDIVETENIIGFIHGKTNRTIVVSAHYDHLGKIGRDYYPGADDNASGVAGLMELAEYFTSVKDLGHNIVFIATSGEESGLLGSAFYVSQEDFDPKSILCNLNLDMISRTDDRHSTGKYLYVIGTDQFEELDRTVRKADDLFKECKFDYSLNDSKDPTGLFTRSDNYTFYNKGIPSIHFFSGLHADYHKQTDTIDKIDFKNLERRIQQLAIVIELLLSDGVEN